VAVTGDAAVAELNDLREVVPGVDMHDRERQGTGPKSLLRQTQQHDRVLARREQQHRPFQFGDHFADDVHGLGLEQSKLVDVHSIEADVGSRHVGSPSLCASTR
jgi:hypothetical protein